MRYQLFISGGVFAVEFTFRQFVFNYQFNFVGIAFLFSLLLLNLIPAGLAINCVEHSYSPFPVASANMDVLSCGVSTHHVHTSVETSEEFVEDGVRNILETIKPWIPFLKDENGNVMSTSDVQIKRLTIATSNKAFKCKYILSDMEPFQNGCAPEDEACKKQRNHPLSKSTELALELSGNEQLRSSMQERGDYLIVRVYGKGSDVLVDRQHELAMIKHFSELNIGPKLYATFENGYVTEYVKGRMLAIEEFQNPYFYVRVAAKLATVHKQTSTGSNIEEGGVWKMLHHWLDVAKKLYPPSFLDEVTAEIKQVEAALAPYKSNICLTHNDVNHGNVIYNPESETVTFVDFEASDFSDRGFDLGNHFCEWAGLDLNFGNYPNSEQQAKFLRAYLSEYRNVSESEITDKEIEELSAEANKYSLVSHLLWYVWSKIQTKISDIPYFNYEEYGRKRMQRYYATKEQFLNL